MRFAWGTILIVGILDAIRLLNAALCMQMPIYVCK